MKVSANVCVSGMWQAAWRLAKEKATDVEQAGALTPSNHISVGRKTAA